MKSIKRSLWQFYRCALKCHGWMKFFDEKWMHDGWMIDAIDGFYLSPKPMASKPK
jgi:hypothetical protein